MGHPDGAHTHGGGSGLGDILAIAAVILILAAVAGPVAAAAVSLLHVLLVAAAVILGLAGVAVAGLVAWRLYRWRHPDAARATDLPPSVARAAQPIPPPQRHAIGPPREVHLHLHGVSAEDVAAALKAARNEADDD